MAVECQNGDEKAIQQSPSPRLGDTSTGTNSGMQKGDVKGENGKDQDPGLYDKTRKGQTASVLNLFSFVDHFDILLLLIGSLGAVTHGAALPIFFLFFGNVINGFGAYQNNLEKMTDVVEKHSLYFVYLGLVVLVSSWAEVACWMHTGERQATKMRIKYLEAILRQDVSFFDTDAQIGMLVDSISTDTLLVQDAISEKMGNFLHHMATFLGGFVVGFSAVWRLCLVTLAVVPVIAFAGGLYAYTLTRLSTKSQQAYGEAGTIAAQTIAQIRTIYSFVGESKSIQSYSEALKMTVKLGYEGGMAKGLGMGVSYALLFSSWALVL
eukprot:c25619_g2_i1 orf=2-967(-)